MKDSMTPLEELRHSTAHVLATAVLRLYPDTKLDIGPPTDNGFYYDFDSSHRFSTEDFEKIEAEMAAIVKENQPFERREVTRDEAIAFFEKSGQSYKVGRVGDIPEGEAISFYQNGEFTDLCAGTHVESTGKIGAFKLLTVAGAYHRGDEKQPMLQRIYGTAFANKKELRLHLKQLEEAAKRDHRKLGTQHQLFRIDGEIGSGLPLLLPKGGIIRKELERMISRKLEDYGYDTVYSPHIGSLDLYKTSGHYQKYGDDMYDPISIDDREFLLKPMNCPMHIQAYTFEPRSYRDLPQRYAEFGTVYRMEQSGELSGMVRVRGFTQDDGHIFCTEDQLRDEFKDCVALIKEVMAIFGLETKCRVSLRDPDSDKYIGAAELWDKAEACITDVVEELQIEHTIGIGEAAFYGPKLDFMAFDALGRGWQLGTIQTDFSLPERFKLEYTGSDGGKHTPVMIHRAVFGSIERFMGLLIEHYAADFPLWLAPEQIRLLPITEDQIPFADEVAAKLKKLRFRVTVDPASDPLGAKIKRARHGLIPVMGVIGQREAEARSIAVRSRKNGEEGAMEVDAFVERLLEERSVVEA